MRVGMGLWRWTGCMAFLVWVVLWSGCATAHKTDWNSRVGHYTFDQAVREYGPPDKSARLQDGSQVAEWLIQRGSSYGTVQALPGFWTQTYQETRTPDYFLRLTFDPSGQLTDWKRLAR